MTAGARRTRWVPCFAESQSMVGGWLIRTLLSTPTTKLRESLIVQCHPLDQAGEVITRNLVSYTAPLYAYVFATRSDGSMVDESQILGTRSANARVLRDVYNSESAYFYFEELCMRQAGYYTLQIGLYWREVPGQPVATVWTESVYVHP
ncbi:uncharacterized protein VTP21DRAFT_2712 [Calcarisporiella thermophila]|uniref:uncharacterized protein n=1 Tax=Calcarisporiella thermophila TaxID=911321 RepID=UPI0037438EBF